MKSMNFGPMLNAYPDSMGGNLSQIVSVLETDLKGCFDSFYILPSLFHSDLDRGFCVIDYDLEQTLASETDLQRLKELGIGLKLDFVLNHQSVQSKEFQDILQKGDASPYRDFFIDWNQFWDGCGVMGQDGYILPEQKYTENMFFRKPGLPILMVDFPDGKSVPYWNTFYQEKRALPDGTIHYLGQMDVNIKSPLVWESYARTLEKLGSYGAELIRLDAFAYASKEPGKWNFLNDPETWDVLQRVQSIADAHGLTLLPEIHASYEEKIYEVLCSKGYMTYDFFLPGLLIYAIEKKDPTTLLLWAKEIQEKKLQVVNMLGCHDGIPVLDLKGFLPEQDIQNLIDLIVERGGYVKNLHGQKGTYYQVNATYFSALGEDEQKLLFARAVQLFMPGKPQIWYLDLFAGKNNYEAVQRAGAGGHKEINRTNLSCEDMKEAMDRTVVQEQLRLLRIRSTCKAFGPDSTLHLEQLDSTLLFTWENADSRITLEADFENYKYKITEEA